MNCPNCNCYISGDISGDLKKVFSCSCKTLLRASGEYDNYSLSTITEQDARDYFLCLSKIYEQEAEVASLEPDWAPNADLAYAISNKVDALIKAFHFGASVEILVPALELCMQRVWADKAFIIARIRGEKLASKEIDPWVLSNINSGHFDDSINLAALGASEGVLEKVIKHFELYNDDLFNMFKRLMKFRNWEKTEWLLAQDWVKSRISKYTRDFAESNCRHKRYVFPH